MNAIAQKGYGCRDVLQFRRIGIPGFGPNDVRIRVHAADVDNADPVDTTGKPLI